MTLNVNLEDVPWEILEAVRLRILAERRAMEQSRLQRRPIALRPQAQFAKLGARADQRRLPEPAAVLDDSLAFNVAAGYFNFNTEENTLTVSTSNFSDSATVSVPAVTNANYTDLFWWVCLPAGNDKMVLAFYFVSDGVKVRFEPRSSFTETVPGTTRLNAGEIFADAGAELERIKHEVTRLDRLFERFLAATCFVGPDPGYVDFEVLSERTDNETGKIYTPERSFIGVEVASTAFVDSLLTFVVSKNSVTQVEPPQQLRSLLFEKFSIADKVISGEREFKTTVENREVAQRIFEAKWSFRSWSFLSSEDCSIGNYGPVDFSFLNPGRIETQLYFTTETETEVFASLNFTEGVEPPTKLLRSYGYGFLVDRQGAQTPGWGWTPSVYAFLRKFEAPADDDTNYQSIRNRYLGNAATSIALTLGHERPNSEASTASNYYYFNIPTESSADFDDPVDFDSSALNLRRVTAGTRANPIQSPDLEETEGWQYDVDNPVKAWDWNRPSACIGELMALGFTAEQLGYTGQTTPARFSFES